MVVICSEKMQRLVSLDLSIGSGILGVGWVEGGETHQYQSFWVLG
jgi:hypothetical protein